MTIIEFGTQHCQCCPKVASSRDGAHDFFRYSPMNNALSPSRADARETVKFRHSHLIHSRPMKHIIKSLNETTHGYMNGLTMPINSTF